LGRLSMLLALRSYADTASSTLSPSACVAHRYLPSFPTRRSSDLVIQFGLAFLLVAGNAHDVFTVLCHPFGVEVDQRLTHALGVRSEEHTSELQSRFDLVCRLLLEKKKTITKQLRLSFDYASE